MNPAPGFLEILVKQNKTKTFHDIKYQYTSFYLRVYFCPSFLFQSLLFFLLPTNHITTDMLSSLSFSLLLCGDVLSLLTHPMMSLRRDQRVPWSVSTPGSLRSSVVAWVPRSSWQEWSVTKRLWYGSVRERSARASARPPHLAPLPSPDRCLLTWDQYVRA